jgi:uncharacterized membrane protein YuzA (DUF378 family)
MDVMNYFKTFNYKDINGYRPIAIILLVVGGLNWGIFGLTGLNVVSLILGTVISRLIFIIVGAAAGYLCYLFYMENFAKKPPTA